jgi:hypothetical protein
VVRGFDKKKGENYRERDTFAKLERFYDSKR